MMENTEKRYFRYLNEGEIIKSNDEHYSTGGWYRFTKKFFGKKYRFLDYYTFVRREIKNFEEVDL